MFSIQNYIFNILLKSLFIFTFLSVFFFLYTKNVVRKELERIIIKIYNENIKNTNIKNFKDQNTNNNIFIDNILKNYTNNIKLKNLKDQTTNTINNNNFILTVDIIIISFLLFCIFLLLIIFNNICKKNILIFKIIMLNLCVYSIIGLIEIKFFNEIGKNYIPIKKNEILNVFKENL